MHRCMKQKKEKNKIMKKTAENLLITCDTCGKFLGPEEDQIGRKCEECLAEENSCGCSDE